MSEYTYFTVVYRYKNPQDIQDFCDKNVTPIMCNLKGNEDLPVQTTGWAVGDTLLELFELQEKYEQK